jgi:glucokinase
MLHFGHGWPAGHLYCIGAGGVGDLSVNIQTLAGIDIGGTKCAVSLGRLRGDMLRPIAKRVFLTPITPEETLERLAVELETLLRENCATAQAIGISCGGPLDSRKGIVQEPPNLPGWININVVDFFRKRFDTPASLRNDADACALAEWRFGAGQGLEHFVFLTFGTGMGAGLILNGKLYSGANGNAGEAGHVALAPDGPIGYGKAGSFEGFCSGGGISKLAHIRAAEQGIVLPDASAKKLGELAQKGDPFSVELFKEAGRRLGQGLAILIDILNPQAVIIGSIYLRQRTLMEPEMRRVLEREALSQSVAICRILSAGLGESVGDYAAMSVAYEELRAQ